MLVNTLILATSILAFANSIPSSMSGPSQSNDSRFIGPVCGIYAVCEALKILGQPVDIELYLTTEYADRETGSNLVQLDRIAQQFGKSIVPIRNLNYCNLESLDPPIIVLLENGPYRHSPVKHWVLIVGHSDSKLQVKDSRYLGLTLEKDIGELLSEWGGKAFVIVDSSNRSSLFLLAQSSISIAIPLSLAIFCWVLWKPVARTGAVGLRHIAIASLGVLLFNYFLVLNAAGWPNQELAAFIASKNEVHQFLEISYEEFVEKRDALVLIDAREPIQFESWSLEDSINLPPSASFTDFKNFKFRHDKTVQIVVFCANEKCPSSDVTASRLKSLGFIDIVVFREGVNRILAGEQDKPIPFEEI